ncbi:hypothetical protein SARC_06209, partial [Sphaeroforma arctica JP610]
AMHARGKIDELIALGAAAKSECRKSHCLGNALGFDVNPWVKGDARIIFPKVCTMKNELTSIRNIKHRVARAIVHMDYSARDLPTQDSPEFLRSKRDTCELMVKEGTSRRSLSAAGLTPPCPMYQIWWRESVPCVLPGEGSARHDSAGKSL